MRRWQRDLDRYGDDRDRGERIPNPLYESQPIPLAEICRCGNEKHADNAVCDGCGDVCGCAYCGGTKEVPDATHQVGDGYEGFLGAGPQKMVACPECAA